MYCLIVNIWKTRKLSWRKWWRTPRLCEIFGFHVGCSFALWFSGFWNSVVGLRSSPAFRRKLLRPSSGGNLVYLSVPSRFTYTNLHPSCRHCYIEDGVSKLLQIVQNELYHHTAPQHSKSQCEDYHQSHLYLFGVWISHGNVLWIKS